MWLQELDLHTLFLIIFFSRHTIWPDQSSAWRDEQKVGCPLEGRCSTARIAIARHAISQHFLINFNCSTQKMKLLELAVKQLLLFWWIARHKSSSFFELSQFEQFNPTPLEDSLEDLHQALPVQHQQSAVGRNQAGHRRTEIGKIESLWSNGHFWGGTVKKRKTNPYLTLPTLNIQKEKKVT